MARSMGLVLNNLWAVLSSSKGGVAGGLSQGWDLELEELGWGKLPNS